MINTPFSPSFIVDISPVWEKKQENLGAYTSQFAGGKTAIGKLEFCQHLNARTRYNGAVIGVLSGEPFIFPGPLGLEG